MEHAQERRPNRADGCNVGLCPRWHASVSEVGWDKTGFARDSIERAEVRPTILRPRCKHALNAGPALERIASRHAPDPSALFPLPSSLTPLPRGDRAREASPRFWGIAGFATAVPLDDLSFRRSPRVR